MTDIINHYPLFNFYRTLVRFIDLILKPPQGHFKWWGQDLKSCFSDNTARWSQQLSELLL